MQETLESTPVEFNLLKVAPTQVPSVRPDTVQPAGLSFERQQELYTRVRPYVREQFQDVTCPAPPAN
jgi:hypothetical protein